MTSGNNVLQGAAPSPNIGGGIWRGPLGTALPTDTTTALNAALISLGYVDEEGVTRKEDRPNTKKYTWGGALFASLQDHYSVTLTFKLLQVLDPDVLKAVHSDGNVTVTAATSTVGALTAVKLNAILNINSAWVVEGFFQAATMRLVIPIARVTQVADLKWTHKDLAAYDVTLECFPDANGDFGQQYWDDGVVSA